MKVIVNNLFKRLNTKKNRLRMVTTNQILPLGSLKRNCVKKCFSGWVLDLVGNGRILTYKLALDVRRRLRKKFALEKEGDDQEARRLHSLLKAARKRQLGKSKAMDELETMPMPECFDLEEDCSDILFLFGGGGGRIGTVNGLVYIGMKIFSAPKIDGTRLPTLLEIHDQFFEVKNWCWWDKNSAAKQKYSKVRSPPFFPA